MRRLEVRESLAAGDPSLRFELLAGEWPDALHLRALQWLLDDHVCAPPTLCVAYEARFVLEIASTGLKAGRTGHAYALDGGPLGAPSADAARGSLLRFTRFALARR